MNRLFLTACLAIALAAAPSGPADWIKSNAIPLKTVEAGHGFDDMAALKQVVGDARIVALGEATHGSREFFQLKHRMLEFLVKEMGFTIFSIEANMPEAYRLNDYVLEGKGDPAELLKGMYFWTWDTEEVLTMIRWMREYNLTTKNKVQFTGFDMQTPDQAAKIVERFVEQHDAEFLPVLRTAAKQAVAAKAPVRTPFGAFHVSAPATALAGKTLRLRGSIRAAKVTGEANLWMRADGGGKALAFRNTFAQAIKGDRDWTEVEVSFEVPPGAESIHFGGTLTGQGTAWFDSLTLEAAGAPVPLHGEADLGFEAATLQGIHSGLASYETALDRDVFAAGKQSLRLRGMAPVVTADAAPDAKAVAAEWKKVVDRLEAIRARLAGNGVPASEIEWAAQNARVVLQATQMRSGEVERDASMARNVRWILDQSPGAKIVLWAHNGHVSAAPHSYRPMGAYLREQYGKAMVIFGFAFNQGSFQAWDNTKAKLRSFTVAPAPAGSLDAELASTGQPALALDLRQAPAALRAPMNTRWAGALYSDAATATYGPTSLNPAAAFDALLFVESTTAARANPPMAVMTPAANGTLRDAVAGVSVRLPEGWKLKSAMRYGKDEQTVTFVRGEESCGLWYSTRYHPRTAAQIEASLAKGIEEKTEQRLRGGLNGYRVLPESRRSHEVNGQPALTWQAEFYENGRRYVETLTRVETPVAIALFFSRAAADQPLDITPLSATLQLPAGQ